MKQDLTKIALEEKNINLNLSGNICSCFGETNGKFSMNHYLGLAFLLSFLALSLQTEWGWLPAGDHRNSSKLLGGDM